jgi:hypothetical protein
MAWRRNDWRRSQAPKRGLVEFATLGPRQRLDEDDAPGHLVVGEPRTAPGGNRLRSDVARTARDDRPDDQSAVL